MTTATEPQAESAQSEVGTAPAEGLITDKAIADAKAMIGLHLRPEGPYLQDATPDTLRNWCNGIGDLNPLYRDMGYGPRRATARCSRTRCSRWHSAGSAGLAGACPACMASTPATTGSCSAMCAPAIASPPIERVVGVEEKQSKFSGRLVLQYVEACYYNQRSELVARALGTCTRHERKAARDAGKYKEIVQHEYTNEERDRIDQIVLDEPKNIRGANIRYWDDVKEGEELPTIARGPLSLMDTMGFLVGSGRGHTHGVVLQGAVKHPGHFFRNPEAGGGVEYTGIGHHRESVAKEVGVPGTYDYGPQRSAWMCTLDHQLDGRCGFPQARPHRDAPLQHRRRHHLLQRARS